MKFTFNHFKDSLRSTREYITFFYQAIKEYEEKPAPQWIAEYIRDDLEKKVHSIEKGNKTNLCKHDELTNLLYQVQKTKVISFKRFKEMEEEFSEIESYADYQKEIELLLYLHNLLDDYFTYLSGIVEIFKEESRSQSGNTKKVDESNTSIADGFKFPVTYKKKLKDFHSALERNELIKDTSQKQFVDFFTGKKIKKPIIWNKDVGQLYYLIRRLRTGFVGENKWQIIEANFIKKNGLPFTNLGSGKYPSQEGKDVIDKILQEQIPDSAELKKN